MDFFHKFAVIAAQIRKLTDLHIEQEMMSPLEDDLIGEELFESFLEDQSSEIEHEQGKGAIAEYYQIKNMSINAALYSQIPYQDSKETSKSEYSFVKTSQKEGPFDQKWLRQVINELSWVGVSISSSDDSIQQLIIEGKQSLIDLKLILMMTSRLAFIFQIIFQQKKGQNQAVYTKAEEECKKYMDFLVQAFQIQSQTRSFSVSKEQQGDYLRKVFNNEQLQSACKLQSISFHEEKGDEEKEIQSKSWNMNEEHFEDPSQE